MTTEHELIKSLISPFNPQNGLADNCSRVPSSSPVGRHGSRGRMPDSDRSMVVQPLPGLAVAAFDDEVVSVPGRHTLHHHLAGWGALGGQSSLSAA